jgi:hypothetical protein
MEMDNSLQLSFLANSNPIEVEEINLIVFEVVWMES